VTELERLLAKLAEIDTETVALNGKLDTLLDKDELTAAEKAEHDTFMDRRAKLADKRSKSLARITNEQTRLANEAQREQLANVATIAGADAERQRRTQASGRLTDADLPNRATILAGQTLPAVARDHAAEGRWGFANIGEFCRQVHTAATRFHGNPTARLAQAYESPAAREYLGSMSLHPQAAEQGLGEAIGSEAGFLVPPTFSTNLFQRMYGSGTLLGMCDNYTVAGNSISFPRNLESSRATGSRYGGVQGYWKEEGVAAPATKPKFGLLQLTLRQLIALCRISDNLLEDSPMALTQYVDRAFTDELNFLTGQAIFAGTGTGQPLGLTNAACTVSVAKDPGQTQKTITSSNIVNMWARLWAGCRAKACWFINQDVEPSLQLLTLGIGTAGIATYMGPGGLSGTPYATILGRPVVPIEFAATLGTVGDIVLADLSHYVTATKGGGPQSAISIHFYFDTNDQAFRITFRIDGQPWWASPLTPFSGTNTQSMCVTLATRA
jgi:HK97 family phage major capsid protein